MQIRILDPRIGRQFPLPRYATEGAAGIDLHACIQAPRQLRSGAVELIGSGIAIYIADRSLMGMVVPRSGLGHRNGIILGNAIGIIDADYQGEIQISCWNRSGEDFEICPGDRIAQLIVVPVCRARLDVVAEFDHGSARGENGFGHTGVAAGAAAAGDSA